MLSTQGDDIDQMVTAERLAILKVGGVAAAVMIVLSLLLASTIAGPVRRLADSAERVRRRIRTRVEIPDFTRRRDEIGHLSGALRDMTDALYNRIEAIETLRRRRRPRIEEPADVAALRGRNAAAGAQREQPRAAARRHRARRQAARPADLRHLRRQPARCRTAAAGHAAPVDLRRLLTTLTTVANETRRGNDVAVEVRFEGRGPTDTFSVPGHDSRLGQVISNLLSNAQSFSERRRQGAHRLPPRARTKSKSWSTTTGPAFGEDALERIFERFYTDRPHQGFGQNSGLGLSISKQIIEAHGGTHLGREPRRRRPTPRASRPRAARASWSGCRRHDADGRLPACTPPPCWSAIARC